MFPSPVQGCSAMHVHMLSRGGCIPCCTDFCSGILLCQGARNHILLFWSGLLMIAFIVAHCRPGAGGPGPGGDEAEPGRGCRGQRRAAVRLRRRAGAARAGHRAAQLAPALHRRDCRHGKSAHSTLGCLPLGALVTLWLDGACLQSACLQLSHCSNANMQCMRCCGARTQLLYV